jgi:hypothetical protein
VENAYDDTEMHEEGRPCNGGGREIGAMCLLPRITKDYGQPLEVKRKAGNDSSEPTRRNQFR